jgi:flagellar hook-associated protein 3 FlgL
MSAIPSILGRVPNMLASQMVLQGITRSNNDLLALQVRLATGKDLVRPSENPVGAGTVAVLDDVLERRDQRLRNLSEASAVLGTLDGALGDVNELLLEAKGVGLSQIGVGSDADTRRNQALVVDSILQSMQQLGNRDHRGLQLFGGSAVGAVPFENILGGVRYAGSGDGARTDIGLGSSTPITMSGERAFGAVSARLEGDRDLDPDATAATRLADLRGARGLGIAAGVVTVTVNGTAVEVDLADAETVEDVRSRVEAGIQSVDAGAVVDLDPAAGDRLRITPSAGVTVTIADADGTTAADLGLDTTFPGGTATTGGDLDPKIVWTTPISALDGVTVPLGTIRVSNAGQDREVDLSGVETLQDLRNAIDELNLGVRVEIGDDGRRLAVRNELSGGSMSISEVGGGSTATELGIRSLSAVTRLEDFNDGEGVGIVTGGVDPLTGLADPTRDVDFTVGLHDGRTFDVDLAGAETVQDVLDAIESAAVAAGLTVPAEFSVGLVDDGNGIALRDATVGAAPVSVTARNNSTAARDLGILGESAGATLTGEDRATVAVDGVFAHLIALRDALLGDDDSGIAFATERLEADIARAAEARAEVGVRAQRVEAATTREEDLRVQDLSLKSTLQDLDVTAAAIRFSQLQQQLQAGLSTAGRITSLTLLDFLR